MLTIAAGTIDGLAYPEMIEEMDREPTKATENFGRVVLVETLRLANETRDIVVRIGGDSDSELVQVYVQYSSEPFSGHYIKSSTLPLQESRHPVLVLR